MRNSVFNKIDESLFKNISEYRSSSFYEKLSEKIRSFTNQKQIILNQVSNVVILTIPIFFVSILLVFKTIKTNEMNLKIDIERKIVSIAESKYQLNLLMRSAVSKVIIEDKSKFIKEINSLLSINGIKKSTVIVDNFEQNGQGSKLQKIETDLKFNSITSLNFTSLLKAIEKKFKPEIIAIKVSKDEDTRLLFGKVHISMISKVAQ